MDVAIHCETQNDAKEFLKFLSDIGIRWNGGNFIDINETYYDEYKDETCYTYLNSGIVFATDDFYRNRDYNVIKFSYIKDFVGDSMKLYTLTENGIIEGDIITKNVEVPVNDTVETYFMKLNDGSVVEIDVDELKEFVLSKKKENKIVYIGEIDLGTGMMCMYLYSDNEYLDFEMYKPTNAEFEVIKTLSYAELYSASLDGIKLPTEMHESMHILEYIVYKLFGSGNND